MGRQKHYSSKGNGYNHYLTLDKLADHENTMKNTVAIIIAVTLMSIGMNAESGILDHLKEFDSFEAFKNLETKTLEKHLVQCTKENFYSCKNHNIITDLARDLRDKYNRQGFGDEDKIFNSIKHLFEVIIFNGELVGVSLSKLDNELLNQESANGELSNNAVGSNSLLSKKGKLIAWTFFALAMLMPEGAAGSLITPLALSTGLLICLDRMVNVISVPLHGFCCGVRWSFYFSGNFPSYKLIKKTKSCTNKITLLEAKNWGASYVDLLCMKPSLWPILSYSNGNHLQHDHGDLNHLRCGYARLKEMWKRKHCSEGQGAMYIMNKIKSLENLNHVNLTAGVRKCIVKDTYGNSYLDAGMNEYSLYECLTALTKHYAEELGISVPTLPPTTTTTTPPPPTTMTITDFMNLTSSASATTIEFLTDSIAQADPADVEEGGDAVLILGVAAGIMIVIAVVGGGIAIKKLMNNRHGSKGGIESDDAMEHITDNMGSITDMNADSIHIQSSSETEATSKGAQKVTINLEDKEDSAGQVLTCHESRVNKKLELIFFSQNFDEKQKVSDFFTIMLGDISEIIDSPFLVDLEIETSIEKYKIKGHLMLREKSFDINGHPVTSWQSLQTRLYIRSNTSSYLEVPGIPKSSTVKTMMLEIINDCKKSVVFKFPSAEGK